jgi:hypothetical protein
MRDNSLYSILQLIVATIIRIIATAIARATFSQTVKPLIDLTDGAIP